MLNTCTFGACDRVAVMWVRTRKPAGSGHMTTDSLMCQRHSDLVTSWGDHGGDYEYVAELLP